MNAHDFVNWLHGFVEACGDVLTPEQCQALRDKLAQFKEQKIHRDGSKEAFIRGLEDKLRDTEKELEEAEKGRKHSPGLSYKEITRQIEEDAKKQRSKLNPDKPFHLATVARGTTGAPRDSAAGPEASNEQ